MKTLLYSAGADMARLEPGDALEIRDFSAFIPADAVADEAREGCWQLTDYLLVNGTPGRMLEVNYRLQNVSYDDFGGGALPPEFEIRLPLKGRYAIYMGMPWLDSRPGMAFPTGVDMALGGGSFVNVGPSFGVRQCKLMAERNREYTCFFKNADLDNTPLRIRVPFGTFLSQPLGLVRATLSLVRFVRLTDDADLRFEAGLAPEQAKPVVMVVDGFSHYFMAGKPGECLDRRLPEAFEGTDVNILMTQITGPTLWKSRVNNYFGENLTPEDYKGKRTGDVRIVKYMNWAVNNGEGPLDVFGPLCREKGMQFHFSIRSNLYFLSEQGYQGGAEKFMNGRWWLDHPDARLPDGKKLDYAKAEVRKFYCDIIREVIDNYEVDGINLDFTRWPPILWPGLHKPQLLVTVVREVHAILEEYRARTGKKLAFSMFFVEDYHAEATLAEQCIDLELLFKEHVLDFIALQSWDMGPWCALGRRYGVPVYAVTESTTIYYKGKRYSHDPLWRTPEGEMQDDPREGSEFLDDAPLDNTLAPFEHYEAINHYYEEGAEGLAIFNHFFGQLNFRDAGHAKAVARRAEDGTVYGQRCESYIYTVKKAR